MIGGQATDIEVKIALESSGILITRNLKTTALMRLAMTAGALAYGAAEADIEALAQFGECLGLAYQIYDDLLDACGDIAFAGKSLGQDSRHLRYTSISELGIKGAYDMAANLIEQAKSTVIDRFGNREETQSLMAAADYIVSAIVKKAISN
jgi:geranylgeranyl pyrophosphate synthase